MTELLGEKGRNIFFLATSKNFNWIGLSLYDMKCFSACLIVVLKMMRDHKLKESAGMNKAMIQTLKRILEKLLQENIPMVQSG